MAFLFGPMGLGTKGNHWRHALLHGGFVIPMSDTDTKADGPTIDYVKLYRSLHVDGKLEQFLDECIKKFLYVDFLAIAEATAESESDRNGRCC